MKKHRPNIAKYHSFIKWNIYDGMKLPGNIILDLAIGRGGDLFKYVSKNQIVKILGIDIDNEAIMEAQKRWDDSRKKIENVNLALLCDDASSDESKLWIKNVLGRKKVAMSCCHFAIHYFFVNETRLLNLVENMSFTVRKKGYVWITCPDGQKLMDLVKGVTKETKEYQVSIPNKDLIDLEKQPYGNKVFYSLKKTRYFTKAKPGKAIMDKGVSEEYLVYIPELIRLFEERGFKLVSQKHFDFWALNYPDNYNVKFLNSTQQEISFCNVNIILQKV